MKNNSMFFRLIKTDLRRCMKLFPQLFIAALLFMTAAFFIIKYSTEIMYENTDFSRLDIAIYINDDSEYDIMGFSLVQEMESYQNSVNLIMVNSEDECLRMLEAGNVYASIIVPDGFIRDFMNCTITPIRIIFNRNNTFEEYLINDLFLYSAVPLGTEQAGVYTINDICVKYNIDDEINHSMQVQLDTEYLTKVLLRQELFSTNSFDELASHSLNETLVSSFIIFILFLMSFILMQFLKESSPSYMMQLKLKGIGKVRFALSKTISVSVSLYSVLLVILAALSFTELKAGFSSLIYMIPAVFIISCVIVIFSLLIKNSATANLTIFIITAIMIYLAGGILPIEQLPAFIGRIYEYNPMTFLIKYVSYSLYPIG